MQEKEPVTQEPATTDNESGQDNPAEQKSDVLQDPQNKPSAGDEAVNKPSSSSDKPLSQ